VDAGGQLADRSSIRSDLALIAEQPKTNGRQDGSFITTRLHLMAVFPLKVNSFSADLKLTFRPEKTKCGLSRIADPSNTAADGLLRSPELGARLGGCSGRATAFDENWTNE